MENHFPVFSKAMANELMNKGYIMRKVATNKNDITQIVFYFEKTDGLEETVKKLSQDFKKYKK